MNTKDYSFAQTLLIIAIFTTIIVISFLLWDRSNNISNITRPIALPTTEVVKDDINLIDADFNKVDSTDYEKQVDNGLTQLGTDISAF